MTIPSFFLSHGSPMNIVEENSYTSFIKTLGVTLEKPKSILIISSHWLTNGTYITYSKNPKQIFDFYGFPKELYAVKYEPAGDLKLAERVRYLLREKSITKLTKDWGIDHAGWTILHHLFPNADVPVVNMSIDNNLSFSDYFEIGQRLSSLRKEGIMIIGSGNIVHNLSLIDFENVDGDPYNWAQDFDEKIKMCMINKDFSKIFDLCSFGKIGSLSCPSTEHIAPLLYIAGTLTAGEQVKCLFSGVQNKSISMSSYAIGF